MGLLGEVAVGLCFAVTAKFAIDAIQALRRGFAVLGTCPGRHLLWMHPFHTSSLVTASFFPPEGWMAHYEGKFALYAKEGSTILSGLVVWDATPMFWLADADAIKVVTSDRFTFRKEVEAYGALEIYGKNLISTDGDEWRRHLGVAGPAFNEANYMLNWSESLRIAHEWFEDLETDLSSKSLGMIINLKDTMTQFTLLVVSAAGFGMRTPWSAFSSSHELGPPTSTDLDRTGVLPFHASLAATIEKLFVKVLTPDLAYALPVRIPWVSAQLDSAKTAFDSLRVHMLDLVSYARNGEKGEANLLRRLVQANDTAQAIGDAGEKGTLTDGELLSNIFSFLLAGHETTAHTLTFAITLLGLNPGAQKKLREEVLRVWPTLGDVHTSTFKRDFDKLEYTLAVFRETLRCFPSEPRLNKIVEADTVLTGTKFKPATAPKKPAKSYDGGSTNVEFDRNEASESKFSVQIPKGSVITMDIWATHMNPLIWGPDAHIFRPERFIDMEDYKWPRDAMLAFSAGARGCIGQRFAITESVCLLACLVRQFEILLPDDADLKNITEDYKRRRLKWMTGITLTPRDTRVRLRRYTE